MRIPLSLLKKYIDISESEQALADRLTGLGIEVEGITLFKPSFSGVVVGRVVSANPHPNAEKLKVAIVDDGVEKKTIVCGAANCAEGMTVALAQIGAKLGIRDDGTCALEIRKASLRGVDSFGMLCSEEELGFAQQSDGILALPDTYALGQDVAAAVADVIFDVAITPNLGHCLSIEGIARELAASYGIAVRMPYEIGTYEAPSDGWTVQIPKSGACLSYGALVISNVASHETPFPIRLALQHFGMRSQGLLVDCVNYVMLCTGQPMHAFDANSFPGRQIVVRESAGGETLQLIDKKTYSIPAGVLTITNGKESLAIAGVMGGSGSAVNDATTKIVVESAIFDAKVVRRSGKGLGLFSEAMRRFERGIDPNGWKRSLFLFWQILHQELPKATLDAYISAGIQNVPAKSITCRLSKVVSILGKKLSRQDMENVFSRLQYLCEWQDADTLCVQVPSYRHDVTEEIDLIEDIAKLTNFAALTVENGPKVALTQMSNHPRYVYESSIRRLLVSLGLQEFVTCDLISPTMADLVAGQPVPRHAMISVLNPISVEQSILRPSLFPSLLECVRRNIDHGNRSICAFEIGTAHLRNEAQLHERLVLGVILSGSGKGDHFSEESREVDYFEMKGILEAIAEYFSIDGLTMRSASISLFHDKRQAVLFCGNQQVGMLGEVHPLVLKKSGVGQRVYFMELDMQDLLKSSQKAGPVSSLALFPSIERDWTLTVPESLPYQELYDTVRQYAGTLVESITLKSIFRHERIGGDKKNVTLRIVFRDQEKTLTSNEVDEGYAKLVEGASLALGVGVCQL